MYNVNYEIEKILESVKESIKIEDIGQIHYMHCTVDGVPLDTLLTTILNTCSYMRLLALMPSLYFLVPQGKQSSASTITLSIGGQSPDL